VARWVIDPDDAQALERILPTLPAAKEEDAR